MDIYDSFARYYEADFAGHTADIALFRDLARHTGGPILEMMCGAGRALLPLAMAGYKITGVDSSAKMLELAREHAEQAKLSNRVTLIQADVRNVALPKRHFRMVFVALNSFGHLETPDDQLTMLKVIRRTLKRSGALVIDMQNPNPARLLADAGHVIPAREYELDDRLVRKSVSYQLDLTAQVSIVAFHYHERDQSGEERERTVQLRLRWLYRYELEHLLARAGFRVHGVYGSYQFGEYRAESPQLIVIASPV